MKRVFAGICVFVLAAIIIGCSSDPTPTEAAGLPDFVINEPTSDDEIFAVGSAKLSNDTLAMQAAEARARAALSVKISVQVKSMITDYQRSAGTDNTQEGLTFYESVSQQLTNNRLTGVSVVKREKGADGTWYVLVKMSKADAASSASAAVKDIIDSEAARYAEFKAMDALKMMNEALGTTPAPAAK